MEPTKDQIIVELECDVEDLKDQIKELDNEKGELLSEICTLTETIDELRDAAKLLTEPPFPDSFYESASDCLQHHDATGKPLTELERQLLIYASELEEILGEIEDALS